MCFCPSQALISYSGRAGRQDIIRDELQWAGKGLSALTREAVGVAAKEDGLSVGRSQEPRRRVHLQQFVHAAVVRRLVADHRRVQRLGRRQPRRLHGL